jgi:hypothetical protein
MNTLNYMTGDAIKILGDNSGCAYIVAKVKGDMLELVGESDDVSIYKLWHVDTILRDCVERADFERLIEYRVVAALQRNRELKEFAEEAKDWGARIFTCLTPDSDETNS